MFSLLGIALIIYGFCQAIKDSFVVPIPEENWANQELQYEDIMAGVPMKDIVKNAKKGKYKLAKPYPEPHRNSDGKIVVENCLLYHEDLKKYGVVRTMKWVDQGKYNLSSEELEKEQERIKKQFGWE